MASTYHRIYPKFGTSGQIALLFKGGNGELNNNAKVQLISTESSVGAYNIMGAWKDRPSCYYWTDHNSQMQWWTVAKVDGGDGKIRYGDKVYITNSQWNQPLAPYYNNEFLSGKVSQSKFVWIIEQAVTVQGGVKRQVLFQNMTVKNDTNDNDDPEAYAIAQIKDHQSGQPFYLGRTYELQAGIRTQILEGFKGEPVQLLDKQEPIQLEIVVWAEDMEIEPAWMQPYLFSRTEETAKAEFQIKPTQSGRRQVRVEFFYQLHWLAKIQFEIEVVEAEEIVLAS